jgi:iron complex transport system substrate-binding protein
MIPFISRIERVRALRDGSAGTRLMLSRTGRLLSLGLFCGFVLLGILGCRDTSGSLDARASWPGFDGIPSSNLVDRCIDEFVPERDYFPDKVEVAYAETFSVSYHGHYKVVRSQSKAPEGETGVSDVLVLVQCGAPVPALDGELAGATVIEVPVRSVAANEDGSIIRASVLGFDDRIVAMGGGGIYNADLRRRWEHREIVSIGESYHGAPDFEALLAVDPGVCFQFISSLDHAESLERGRALGLPFVPVLAWSEPTILGQAEWVKHTALFLNAERDAASFFEDIVSRYRALAKQAQAASEKPVAIWGGPLGNGGWYVEAGSWHAQALDDAGATNPFDALPGERTIAISTESVLAEAVDADLWITEEISMENLGAAGLLEQIEAFQAGQVYHIHGRSRPEHNAYDWYETALVRPDLVLEDLVSLFHPELLPDHELFFLRSIR